MDDDDANIDVDVDNKHRRENNCNDAMVVVAAINYNFMRLDSLAAQIVVRQVVCKKVISKHC